MALDFDPTSFVSALAAVGAVIIVATLISGLFARSIVLWPALCAGGLDRESRQYVTWFGPRALSSRLLVLLPVFAGLAAAEQLFPLVAMMVLGSVVVHGAMVMARQRRLGTGEPASEPELTTIAEYRDLIGSGASVRLLDVRAPGEWQEAAMSVPVRGRGGRLH